MTDGPRRRVAVVDDSPEVLALLGEALSADHFDVSLFDGATTVADLERSAPDLLLVDWRVTTTGLTGLEIIRAARVHPILQDVPIVVCSAAEDEVAAPADELERTPRVFQLRKPFSLDELEACVRRALGTSVGAPSMPRS